MRIAFALVIFAALACGQATVLFTPQSMVSIKSITGSKTMVGEWTVAVCSDSPAVQTIPRERILMGAPSIRVMPTHQAEDVLGRGAANDPKSIIGNNGDTVLALTSTGLSVAGLATDVPNMQWVGLGITGLRLVFQVLKARAPDPRPYFSDQLPAEIRLQPARCATFLLFASLMPREQVRPIGPVAIRH